jgi:hypothetical protein
MIGLYRNHADEAGIDIVYQLAGQTGIVHEADWKTLAINTWYIFGMRYVPAAKKLDFYWGTGDRNSTTIVAKDDNPILSTDIGHASEFFPDGQGLAPMIATKWGGTAEYLDIRTMACGQLAYSAD